MHFVLKKPMCLGALRAIMEEGLFSFGGITLYYKMSFLLLPWFGSQSEFCSSNWSICLIQMFCAP